MGVTVKKPCSQIQIRFTGLDIKIGATTIYYAYVRDAVENDISTYFSASEVTISGNSYHLPQPSVGQPVVWTLTDWPSGSAPQVIQSENKIIGMTVDGDYTLTTTYSSSVSGYSAALSSQDNSQRTHPNLVRPASSTVTHTRISWGDLVDIASANTAEDLLKYIVLHNLYYL